MNLETFFEKFDLFADCPNAVQKMRELILELAVQGMLVDQDEREEPTDPDALVSQREAWLRRFGLNVKPFVDSTTVALLEVPSSWRVLNFGLLGRAQAGFAFNSSGFTSNVVGSVPIIRIRDIHSGATQTNFRGEFRSEFLVNHGDYLVGMDGNFAIAKWMGGCALLNQRVTRLQWFSELIEPSYVVIALQKRLRELQGVKAYTTVDHLSTKQIEEALIPLPPLAEQKRIMAKVDELMALCDALEAQQKERETNRTALAKASLAAFAEAPSPQSLELLFHPSYAIDPADLRKSILTLAVQGKLVEQDPGDESGELLLRRILALKPGKKFRGIAESTSTESIPDSWCWSRLGVVFDVRDGTHDTPRYVDDGVPLVTSKNISSGKLSLVGAKHISRVDHIQICDRSKVDVGDILFAMIGSIGNPVIVDLSEEFSIKNVALFKPIDASLVEMRYLLHYLILSAERMKELSAGGVQAFVSLGFLRSYPFPLPPLAEQKRIVAKVDELMALVDRLEAKEKAARETASRLLEAMVAELSGRGGGVTLFGIPKQTEHQ